MFMDGILSETTKAWLVNANGEIAGGFERPKRIGGSDGKGWQWAPLSDNERSDLLAVATGELSFEEHERRVTGGGPELA